MPRIHAPFRSPFWPFKGFKAYIVSGMILTTFPLGWHLPSASTSPVLSMPINMSLQDTLLFISDRSTGIHVYNIKNPAAPRFALNIPLHGNRGTAARGDILYANDYGSLLAIRVEGDSYEVVKTIKHGPPRFDDTFVIDDHSGGWGCACSRQDIILPAPSSGSIGSSYATFTVIDSYLYYLEHSSIVTMSISKPEDPVEVSQTPIDWSIETLYPTERYLFAGGTRGMHIFDRSDPESPTEIARVEHFRACDPVVVSDTLAFVTLRGGNRCGETRDVLLSISVSDPANPKVIGEKSINTPHGLAISDPLLYVSTGDNGYELLNIAGPDKPYVVKAWSDWATKDFIWFEDVLFVLGYHDARIYDVTVPEKPVLLSKLE